MSLVEGFTPRPVMALGGLCNYLERSEVPVGMSPNCADIEFRPKTILSRPGLGLRFTDESAFRGIKSFYGQDRIRRLMVLDDVGKLSVETPEGQLDTIYPSRTAGAFLKSIYAFDRLWMCLSDGKRPLEFPVLYDPAPSTTVPFAVGPVTPEPPSSIAHQWGDGAAGLNHAGLHYFFYTYEDKYGRGSGPSSIVAFNAGASKKAEFINIFVGPSTFAGDTIRRRLWVTPAYVTGSGVAGFFNIGVLNIEDNTATSLTADFTDAMLQNGERWEANNLTLVSPPPAIGVTKYADRLVFWGVTPTIVPFLAERVDGLGSDIVMLGRPGITFADVLNSVWTFTTGGAGGQSAQTQYNSPGILSGNCAVFAGGVANVVDAYRDVLNVLASANQDAQYWLKPGQRYGFQIRVRPPAAGNGNMIVDLIAQTSATVLATVTIPSNDDDMWKIYTAPSSAVVPGGTATIRFRVRTTAQNTNWPSDWMQPFLSAQQFDGSTAWIGDNLIPTNFDLVKSPLPVAPGDWQEVRCCFEQTGNLYIVKEHSTWVTSDNGSDPNTWNIDNVSFLMGTPSVHGVGLAPEFAIIAGREGVYRFDSGGILKISQEIETTWRGVDWLSGHRLWVTVDASLKIVRVAIPLKGDERTPDVCHVILKCDYSEGWGEGWKDGDGASRKWTIDNVETTCAEMAEKDDGSSNLLLGGQRTSSNNLQANVFTIGAAPWVQIGTRAATPTYNQIQPMGPHPGLAVSAGYKWATQWSFPFSSGTARYRAKGNTAAAFLALGEYFVASFWGKAVAPTSIAATIKDPYGTADFPIVLTTAWQRFVATFGPNDVAKQTVADGAMAATSTVLTSASGLFVAGDVGKDISVGPSVTPFYTTIVGFTDPNTVTLGAANPLGSPIANQTVIWGRAESLDIDLGTLTVNPTTVVLFGGQAQTGQFDKGWSGDVSSTGANNTGTALDAGFLAEPIVYDPGSNPPWKTSDWDGIITPIYEFAPFGSDLGRSNFNRIIARIRGAGQLEAYYVAPNGTTTPLNQGTFPILVAAPRNDIEMGGSISDTYVGLRLRMSGLSSWFALKRFGIFSKAHEGAPYRGKS